MSADRLSLGIDPAMLAGLGAQYGGSIAAIVVNLPGESSSVVTTIDGYQMAKQGRAGVALATAAIGSFFAGCVTTLALAALAVAALAGPLTATALLFGPKEFPMIEDWSESSAFSYG